MPRREPRCRNRRTPARTFRGIPQWLVVPWTWPASFRVGGALGCDSSMAAGHYGGKRGKRRSVPDAEHYLAEVLVRRDVVVRGGRVGDRVRRIDDRLELGAREERQDLGAERVGDRDLLGERAR